MPGMRRHEKQLQEKAYKRLLPKRRSQCFQSIGTGNAEKRKAAVPVERRQRYLPAWNVLFIDGIVMPQVCYE